MSASVIKSIQLKKKKKKKKILKKKSIKPIISN